MQNEHIQVQTKRQWCARKAQTPEQELQTKVFHLFSVFPHVLVLDKLEVVEFLFKMLLRKREQRNTRNINTCTNLAIIERFSIAFTANVRPNFPVYQKLVKFTCFQLIFCLLVTAMEQVLKTEK